MLYFAQFLSRCPAFVYGLFFLLGLAFAKALSFSLCIPLIALTCFFLLQSLSWKQRIHRLLPFLVTAILAYSYGLLGKASLSSDTTEISGTAYFSPREIKPHSSPFHRSYKIEGMIEYFQGDRGEIGKRIPCSLYLPQKEDRPPITHDFIIKGSLQKTEDLWSYKANPPSSWTPTPYSFSLAEWRFQTKRYLSTWIKSQFSDKKTATFLSALSIGDLNDRMLRFEFSKLGLQHILAISGFHFGLLSLFLSYLLKKLLPEKIALTALLCLVTAYFFLLGSSPSILRAWIAISFYILGCLFRMSPSGLNVLGIGLLVELIFYPETISHLGFQFSFLSTAAILILLPMCTSWMEKILPKRSYEDLLHFSWIEKTAYLICSFLRSALALNLAVHLAMVPVCLFYFHTFPLLSFLYNLFFPLGVCLSLFLLMVSLLFIWPFPVIAKSLCTCNEAVTSFLLSLSSHPPSYLEGYLSISQLSSSLLVSFLLVLFSFGIYSSYRLKQSFT